MPSPNTDSVMLHGMLDRLNSTFPGVGSAGCTRSVRLGCSTPSRYHSSTWIVGKEPGGEPRITLPFQCNRVPGQKMLLAWSSRVSVRVAGVQLPQTALLQVPPQQSVSREQTEASAPQLCALTIRLPTRQLSATHKNRRRGRSFIVTTTDCCLTDEMNEMREGEREGRARQMEVLLNSCFCFCRLGGGALL